MHLVLMALGAMSCTSFGFVGGVGWANMQRATRAAEESAIDAAWIEPGRGRSRAERSDDNVTHLFFARV